MSDKRLFLEKGGEMGSLTRAYDWAATTIGNPGTWSQSHLTSVNMMLTSRFPMLVFWGSDLITFYNDAFRPSLGSDGKHPGSLGQPGHQSWSESWPVIGPMINNIMQGGEAVYFEDQKLPLYRDGKMGYAYWTYSFSPLLDDDGSVGGVLVTCSETTKTVESTAKLAESESRFQNLIREAAIGIVVLLGEQWKIAVANDSFAKIIGQKVKDITGKGLFEILPEAKDRFDPIMQSVFKEGRSVYSNDVPYAVTNELGETIDGYVNIVYQPYREEDGTVTGIIEIIQDVTNKVTAERTMAAMYERELSLYKEIAESEERFRNMAESTEMLIAVGDENGNAVYFNKAWEKLTGRTVEELKANGWIDLMYPEDMQRVLKIYLQAFEKRLPWEWEFRMPDKKGGYHWLLARGTPRFRSDNSFAGYISATLDIDERKRDEQRKNDFIGMVSHELKTPITSLTAYLQILSRNADKQDDVFSGSLIDKAVKQVRKMTTMINGFLNVSRLESGKINIDKQHFDLADLVKEVEAETLSSITTHHIIFAPVEPTPVEADRDKIGQVINNLISNAVKYSPQGSTINVACVTTGNVAKVSVKDPGIGVAAADLEKLFDRYYRVDNPDTRFISGFGIGLYLCREIIERHNGTISAESEPGKGSTFYFTLPVEISGA